MKTFEVYDRDGNGYTIMMDSKDYNWALELKWYLPHTTDEIDKMTTTPVVRQRGSQLDHHPLHRSIARQVYAEASAHYPKGIRVNRTQGWRDFRRSAMTIDGVPLTDLNIIAPALPREDETPNGINPTQQKVLEHFAYRVTQHYESGEYEKANSLITVAEAIDPDYIYALLAENIVWK